MKNTNIAVLAILTAALAAPAFADTANPSREQVKAEYVRALKAGELDYAREFDSPVVAANRLAAATATANAAKIENLPPTAAGVDKAAQPAPAKTSSN